MKEELRLAPALQVSQWLNSRQAITLEQLRGKVVVLHAFQMLCPGCVSHGIPQALAVHRTFPQESVAVIGLHSVFEHHEAMTAVSLKAFIHEYKLSFPIAIDQAAAVGPVPLTMQAYGLRGTPSLVLIDKAGYVRLHHFGRVDDLQLGALIGQLLAEPASPAAVADIAQGQSQNGLICDAQGCPI
ncbi:redoxin domain-containing protein [Paraherbaspirillum soli]|uniref:Redoxin domain-containing protein n=1 Tax=Paraherbaspirillum soli TaxID=631222 RepID=A0ABW0M9K8_9BURK